MRVDSFNDTRGDQTDVDRSTSMKKPASTTCLLGLTLVVAWIPAHHAWGETNRTGATVAPPLRLESEKVHAASSGLPQPLPPNLKLSHWTTEIVRLVQSGADESILLAFVKNSGTFNLAADHIVYLGDLGVADRVVNAMLIHDQEALARQRQTSHNLAGTTNSTSAVAVLGRGETPRSEPSLHGYPALSTGSSQIHSNQPPSAQKVKKAIYPVREPYPVQITAPIVFLDSPSF